MTKKEKASIIKRMDEIMKNSNDENYWMVWITYGCPDGSTDEDYIEYADDFEDMLKVFLSIIEEKINEYGYWD